MKIFQTLQQKTPEWFEERKGVITGSRLKKIVGTPYMKKETFYEVLAERLSVGDYDEETAMQRGIRLEDDARKEYTKETGYEVEVPGFTKREDNLFMGESPDGLIQTDGKYTRALEIKCLGSKNHVRAKLEGQIPDDYLPQVIQKFIVNDDLEVVDFVMYDPRIASFPYLKFSLFREDYVELIEKYRKTQEDFLNEVNETLKKLISL